MKRVATMLGGIAAIAFFVHCKGDTLTVGGAAAGTEVWTGYFQGAQFPSGADSVTLTLHSETDGGAAGTIYFGDQPPLPTPNDPNAGWPPGRDDWRGFEEAPFPFERFAFTLFNVSRDKARMRFDVVGDEIYKQWCDLQPASYPLHENANPVVDGGAPTDAGISGYGCLPSPVRTNILDGGCTWNADDGTGDHPIGCGKIGLCSPSVCACTISGCTVDANWSTAASSTIPNAARSYHFDLSVDGDKATGTAEGIASVSGRTLNLTRQ